MHLRQPQARAVAADLGREEGLEDLAEDLRLDALAFVGDLDRDRLRMVRRGRMPGLDAQPAAQVHGVAGVRRQVGHRDLELERIQRDPRQALLRAEMELAVRADQRAQRVLHLGQHRGDLERARLVASPTRQQRQLPRQRLGLLDAAAHHLDVALDRFAGASPDDGQAAGEHLQDVVEVMRQAGAQAPHRVQLLRAGELGLRRLALLDLRLQLLGAMLQRQVGVGQALLHRAEMHRDHAQHHRVRQQAFSPGHVPGDRVALPAVGAQPDAGAFRDQHEGQPRVDRPAEQPPAPDQQYRDRGRADAEVGADAAHRTEELAVPVRPQGAEVGELRTHRQGTGGQQGGQQRPGTRPATGGADRVGLRQDRPDHEQAEARAPADEQPADRMGRAEDGPVREKRAGEGQHMQDRHQAREQVGRGHDDMGAVRPRRRDQQPEGGQVDHRGGGAIDAADVGQRRPGPRRPGRHRRHRDQHQRAKEGHGPALRRTGLLLHEPTVWHRLSLASTCTRSSAKPARRHAARRGECLPRELATRAGAGGVPASIGPRFSAPACKCTAPHRLVARV